jgi:hypothetical protein
MKLMDWRIDINNLMNVKVISNFEINSKLTLDQHP